VFTTLGMASVQRGIDEVRDELDATRFATGMRVPVRAFFEQAGARLDQSNQKIAEVSHMMETMYRKFSSEHGLTLPIPMPFSLDKYRSDLDAIEAIFFKQFGTTTLIISSRSALFERFFDSIASRVRRLFRAANADVEAWLKVIMAPLEAQIRQHKDQLKHRQASIARIHDATDSLEQKITSFEASQADLEQVRNRLLELAATVGAALDAPARKLAVAA
jgi:uncharacterized protein YdcH (DUF465 family)